LVERVLHQYLPFCKRSSILHQWLRLGLPFLLS